MWSRRLPLFFVAILMGSFVFAAVHRGYAQSVSSRDYVIGLGNPGIDRGAVSDDSRLQRAAPRRATLLARRVIVRFRDDLSIADREEAVTEASPGATVETRRPYADFDVVRLALNADAEAVARSLTDRADVEYAQPSHRFHAENFVPNDPDYKTLQWNFPLIDMERAWEITCARSTNASTCEAGAGSSITVAVVDTGVAYRDAALIATLPAFTINGVRYPALGRQTMTFSMAPDLAPSTRFVKPKTFLSSCDNAGCVPVCATDPALDLDGHGTHVSGTIGQATNNGAGPAGIAFNVKIMPVKVLSSVWDVLTGCGDDEGGTEDDVALGIRYAADNGANVINLSLGADGPPGSSPVIEDAMKYAVGKGAFIAVAGGNSFEDGNPPQVISEIASRIKGAVSVAAVDPLKNRAFYSSTGNFIELAAPGGSTRPFLIAGAIRQQTYDPAVTDTFLLPPIAFKPPRFDVFATVAYQGTSQATPHVTALAALMMQQGITDPAAIEDAMERYATHLGDPCSTTPCRNDQFGFGLIEARNALRGMGLAK